MRALIRLLRFWALKSSVDSSLACAMGAHRPRGIGSGVQALVGEEEGMAVGV
jgi:hypothetical protein